MEGFCDQIARQYDTLAAQTQVEPSTSSEDFVTPLRTDLTDSDSWLELGEFNDEAVVLSTQLQQSGTDHFSFELFSIDLVPFSGIFVCGNRRK